MVFGGARFLQEAIPDLPERSKRFTTVSILSSTWFTTVSILSSTWFTTVSILSSTWFTTVSILSINGLLHLLWRNDVYDVTSITMNTDVWVSCRATYGFMEEAERSGDTEKETLLNKLLKVGNCLLETPYQLVSQVGWLLEFSVIGGLEESP